MLSIESFSQSPDKALVRTAKRVAQRKCYAALDVTQHSSHDGRYRPYPGTRSAI